MISDFEGNISLNISFHFFIDFWSLWRSRSSSTIVEAPQLRKRLFTTFSWPYFYPMSNLHFKAYTMLLCLLSNKNTTHVFRSTKLNKKEKKLYVDAPDESIFGWTKAVAPMLFFLGHYFVIGLWNSILLTKKRGFFCCLFCFLYAQMAGSFDCHQNGWKILRMVDSIGMLQIYQVNVYFVYKQKNYPYSSSNYINENINTYHHSD